MRMNRMEIPANPAHMGIPEINRINALPNKSKAIILSLI
jgi:hypothetical protein